MRTRLAAAGGAVLLSLAAGAAEAAVLRGTDLADRLRGTAAADEIHGRGGDDVLEGLAGPDLLHGGPGRDALRGGAGRDRIVAALDAAPDTVRCGTGPDLVSAEAHDRVAADCEVVVRQLARDTLADPRGQHETQAEPDTFAAGRTIVAAFQVGRYVDGGASAIGWATSGDGGATWRDGLLPGLTLFSAPPGTNLVASDPSVAWDAVHRTWLVVTLGVAPDGMSFLASRSTDGIRWQLPVTAVRTPRQTIDKEWVACDNGTRSRFRGRCYIAYLDFEADHIAVVHSDDGGLTWSAPVGSRAGIDTRGIVNGAQLAALPDGALVVVFSLFGVFADLGADQILAMRSRDGGATFEPAARIAFLRAEHVSAIRAPPFVSLEADGGGRLWAAWQDCRHNEDCGGNRIVVASSADGVSWTAPAPLPMPAASAPLDAFVPGLAADPTRRGESTRLAVVFHTAPQAGACPPTECRGIDVWLVRSDDAGRRWSTPQRLSPRTVRLPWIADTGLGRMLGDYVSASWAGGRPVAVFALADERAGGGAFRQAVFAARG